MSARASITMSTLISLTLYNMKKTILLVAALAALVACSSPKEATVKAVYDDCGVAKLMDTSDKSVYLVFTAEFSTNDNGYFENFDGIVPVLDTLADRGVKGSFFPTGNCFRVEKYAEPIRRIIAEGHYLSHHSNHHLLLCTEDAEKRTLVDMDSLKVDISAMEAEMARFGLEKKDYTWMIPPYEYYNAETAQNLIDLGYKLVNPTPGIITGHDWMPKEASNYMSAEDQVQTIWDYEASSETGLNGAVILVHAMNYPCRTDEDRVHTHLGEIIDGLRERGYSFKTFKEL